MMQTRKLAKAVFIVLLLLTVQIAFSCPNDEKLQFFNAQKGPGFYMQGQYGQDSYLAFLYGKDFSKVESTSPNDERRFFKIDGIAYEQLVTRRSAYSKSTSLTDEENLDAHYRWDLAFVKKLQKRKQIELKGHTKYGVVERKNTSGHARKFFIWEASLAGAKQYFVTTTSSFGVVGLSVIGVKPSQEDEVKLVIDNYMYSYKNLGTPECVSSD